MTLTCRAPTTTCQAQCWALYVYFSFTGLSLCVCNTHTCKDMEKTPSCFLLEADTTEGECYCNVWSNWRDIVWYLCRKPALCCLAAAATFRPCSPQLLVSRPQSFKIITALPIAAFHGIGHLLCLIQGSGLEITSFSSTSEILYLPKQFQKWEMIRTWIRIRRYQAFLLWK